MTSMTTTMVCTITVQTENGFTYEIRDLGCTTTLTVSVDGVAVETCDAVSVELQDLEPGAQFDWVEYVFDGSVVHRTGGVITSVFI